MCQAVKNSVLINESLDMRWVNLSTSRSVEEVGTFSMIKCLRILSLYIRTAWMLVSWRPHLCYLATTCHGMGFLKDAPVVLLARSLCSRVVIHHHNKGMRNDPRWLKLLQRWVYKNSRLILLSERLFEDVASVVERHQVEICPNGIELARDFRGQVVASSSDILFIGHLLPSKGIYVLLDALKMLKDEGLEVHCRVVGGENAAFVKVVEKAGLSDSVEILGFKEGGEKDQLFREAAIVVLPTLDDCFPLVLLEAMREGKPVVSTRVGGIEDIVEDGVTGLLVEAGDARALAAALRRLLDNPLEAQQMGATGRRRFEDCFTHERFEERLLSILLKVAREP